MSAPTVTVVIPTYNRASLVGETIRSVLEQTYADLEVVVLDDHSGDNTKQVVGSFSDPRIKYLRHVCNVGFVANWTYGLQLAQGQYTAILGDDDYYLPEFLNRRIDAFGRYGNVLAVTGPFECRDIENTIIRHSKDPLKDGAELSGLELTKFALGFSGEWFNGATLYRTDTVRSLWPKASLAGTALDLSFHIRLSLLPGGRVVFLQDRDMILRVHPAQESRSNSLYLAECAAKLAMQLWHFEVRGQPYPVRQLFRRRFAADLNHYGRMLWDGGRVTEARAAFLNELSINPARPKTWLRWLRTFLVQPVPADVLEP